MALLLGLPFFAPVASAAGNTTGYAWSSKIGWVNFGCDGCNAQVTSSVLTGYAWNDNYGWIKLDVSSPDGTGGIKNTTSGVLSGYAWGDNVGWIDFAGVTISTSSGEFSGTATGDSRSDIVGTLNFDCATCNVQTTWRPTTTTSGGGGGGLPSEAYDLPKALLDELAIKINNGASTTSDRIVTLNFNASSNVKKVAISMTGDFSDASQQDYQSQMQWDLCSKMSGLIKQSTCPNGTYTVYAKFFTFYGQSSKVISTSVILNSKGETINIKPAAEGNEITNPIQNQQPNQPNKFNQPSSFLSGIKPLLSKIFGIEKSAVNHVKQGAKSFFNFFWWLFGKCFNF